MHNRANRYQAFLLRLWREKSGWRATVEDARWGGRLGFASLEQLFAHLLQLGEASGKALTDGPDAHPPTNS
jgi:hypothetical protein